MLPVIFAKILNWGGQQRRLFLLRWTQSKPKGTSKLMPEPLKDRQSITGSYLYILAYRQRRCVVTPPYELTGKGSSIAQHLNEGRATGIFLNSV